MVGDADDPLVGSHPPGVDRFTHFSVPYVDGLVCTASREALRVPRPRYPEDAALVLVIPNLCLSLPCFAIVEKYLPVRTHTDQCAPVRTEAQPIHIPLMPLQARIELERHSVVKHRTGIVTRRRRPQRSLLPYAHAIDLRCMPAYGPHAIARICGYAMPEFLLPVTYGDDALAVAVPAQVVDPTAYDGEFTLGGAGAGAVPYSDGAGHVTGGDIVA